MQTIKQAISCGSIKNYIINTKLKGTHIPVVGDVGIFEVVKIGKHPSLQSPQASNIKIFEGDRIMATFGHRYATQVFEGILPDTPQPIYHLIGKGGVVAIVKQSNAKAETIGPTLLKFIGFATRPNSNDVLNTIALRQPIVEPKWNNDFSGKIILSIGSSMDSGKTTTAGYLCGGLKRAGNKVAFIKLTGTVFAKDVHFVRDRGADKAIDFSHFGYPSTYLCELDELLELHTALVEEVQSIEPDYIVIEIADGLLQRETNLLLSSKKFMKTIDGVVLSCGDSLGVLGGLEWLSKLGIQPFAISGLFTISPMLVDEIRYQIRQPVLTLNQLLMININHMMNKELIPEPDAALFNVQ